MRPSSSAMTAKMKSVWASGRKPHFAWPAPSPVPVHAARRDADERLPHLEAESSAVRGEVEEGRASARAGRARS